MAFRYSLGRPTAMILKLSGETDVFADRAAVWDALHDTSCLKLCIAGCQTMRRVSPTRYELSVRVGLGPLSIAVAGAVEIHESDPLRMLCLKASGSGGLAGLVAGYLEMRLEESARGCRIVYAVKVEPRGVFVALGEDVLVYRARRSIGRFVETFAAVVGQQPTVRVVAPQAVIRWSGSRP